jgi:RNA polymerase sigma factor (sigma-70 family)
MKIKSAVQIKMKDELSDKELIEGMINNDDGIIQYFFFEKCTSMFRYIIQKIFDCQVEKDELINELYLFLQMDDWRKLRQFDYRSRLTTWLSVVAIRFFQKKRAGLIENNAADTLYIEKTDNSEERIYRNLDIKTLIGELPNERYRFVIQRLILEDKEPQEVANEMKITVDNLYNIKRRAIQQIAQIARKGDSHVE